ncbi:MAG: hypothetical protein ACRDL7_00045, partial [Gaiellaceae bacterium]
MGRAQWAIAHGATVGGLSPADCPTSTGHDVCGHCRALSADAYWGCGGWTCVVWNEEMTFPSLSSAEDYLKEKLQDFYDQGQVLNDRIIGIGKLLKIARDRNDQQ